MKPIEFEGQTIVLQRPPGMTEAECGSLAILRLDGTCISCWKMGWKERLKALFTGKIWLGVLSGHTQPAVYVAIDQPFKIEKPAQPASPFIGEPMAFIPVCRKSQRPPEAIEALQRMGVTDVSLENKLEVRAEGDTTEIVLIGAIGKSWWDDSGITEQEVRDAIKSSPKGKPINIHLNSEGGSVKEGLGIYNAIKERNADIQCRVTGYALSIASVFPLAAKKSLGGRGVVSPKSAIWMEHKAWSYAQGNADDMRQAALMLDTHDETLVDIYAAATGKTKDEIRSRMEKETWTKGSDAIAAGLADITDDEGDAQASYRPLHPDFLQRCKNISPAILNTLSAPMQGAAKHTTTNPTKDNTMNRAQRIALLNAWGVMIKDEAAVTDARLEELVNLGTIAARASFTKHGTAMHVAEPAAKKEGEDDNADIRAEFKALKVQRATDRVNTYVDAQKITKAEVPIFVTAMLADEAGTLAILDAKEAPMAGAAGTTAGAFLDPMAMDHSPAVSAAGVQGNKILPELENIFAAHKVPAAATKEQKLATTAARYEAMKSEFPRLLKAAFKRDNGVQGANTFSGTITTNFLIMGVTLKTANRFAAANLFTMDAEQDPYKPLAAGIRKFNATTTDGTKVGKNVTNFQTLAGGTNGNPDSVVNAITITPDQYTSGGYITNAQLNSGFRVADIIEPKIIDLADQITQVFTAPITVANFVTNAALVSAPGVFGFSDLATLQGQMKKLPVKNLLLDGEYIARISNVPGFFQGAGTVGGATNAWSAYGWDNIALNTEWAGAGANVRGFACGKTAIGIISGIPLNPPEGIPGNIVQTGVAQLPDVQKAIGTYVWFDPSSRTLYFTFDMIAGATLIDETAGILVKSA